MNYKEFLERLGVNVGHRKQGMVEGTAGGRHIFSIQGQQKNIPKAAIVKKTAIVKKNYHMMLLLFSG